MLEHSPVESLLIGFTLIFIVTFLKAVGRLILPALTRDKEAPLKLNTSKNQVKTNEDT